MKKIHLRGFSLVEILIALAIVAVMAEMFVAGFKQNAKAAYKNYYYNAYNTMKSVIMYASENTKYIGSGSASGCTPCGYHRCWCHGDVPDPNCQGSCYSVCPTCISLGFRYGIPYGFPYEIPGGCSQERHKTGDHEGLYGACQDAFGLSSKPTDGEEFSAKNGVKYKITTDGNNYNIVTKIPSHNGIVTFNMKYFPGVNDGILVPGSATLPDGSKFNLYDRRDLLPCYIRTGNESGISHYYDTNSGSFNTKIASDGEKRAYYSYKNAYCSLKGDYRSDSVVSYLGGCGNINQTTEGIVFTANPRNLPTGKKGTVSTGSTNDPNNCSPCGYYDCWHHGHVSDPNCQGSCYTVCPICASKGFPYGMPYGYAH